MLQLELAALHQLHVEYADHHLASLCLSCRTLVVAQETTVQPQPRNAPLHSACPMMIWGPSGHELRLTKDTGIQQWCLHSVLSCLPCRTLVVTEETILHPSRNPHLSKDEKEHILKEYLGLEKIIW